MGRIGRNFFIILLLVLHPYVSFASWEEEFSQMKEKITLYETYHYPYGSLGLQLQNQGKVTFTIFSYGSLLIEESALKTLSPETVKTSRPALAFGILRIFNRDVAIRSNSHWGVPKNPNARGMLNVEYSENPFEIVNGVLIDIQIEEIEPLMKREEGYDLIPVLVMDMVASQKENKPIYSVAYTFHAPRGTKYTSENIEPRPGYFETSRDASKKYGPLFYHLWMESTVKANFKPLDS